MKNQMEALELANEKIKFLDKKNKEVVSKNLRTADRGIKYISNNMDDIQKKLMWNKLCNIEDKLDRIEDKLDKLLESGDIDGKK